MGSLAAEILDCVGAGGHLVDETIYRDGLGNSLFEALLHAAQAKWNRDKPATPPKWRR